MRIELPRVFRGAIDETNEPEARKREHPMKIRIRDRGALDTVAPVALSAYARDAGWAKTATYGDHSDVYAHEHAPEIIIPRTQRLGDYPEVVSRLIGIFAEFAETDELSLYRDLVTADRDVVRVKAALEEPRGSVALKDGVKLINGAHDMFLAAARSLYGPKQYYRPSAIQEVNELMQKIHLGQTEHGSFIITLMTPVVPPPFRMPSPLDSMGEDELSMEDVPIERQMTLNLLEALTAAREATERTSAGEMDAFLKTVSRGASADFCNALAMLIEPFGGVDIGLTWARTWPMETARETVRFGAADAPILREAARRFREYEPMSAVSILGHIQQLSREDRETDGTVTLRTYIDGRVASVPAGLRGPDYDRAIQAHKNNDLVVIKGDLERLGDRWRFRNADIEEIISSENGDGHLN